MCPAVADIAVAATSETVVHARTGMADRPETAAHMAEAAAHAADPAAGIVRHFGPRSLREFDVVAP